MVVGLFAVAGAGAAKPAPKKKAKVVLRKGDLAIVDPADEMTEVRGLAGTFGALKVPFVDLTKDVAKGKLALGGARALFIGSFAETVPEVKATLAGAAADIAAFVAGGGVLVVLAQPDEVSPTSPYLPAGLRAVRGDLDYDAPKLLGPAHPAFAGLAATDLEAWEVDAGTWEYATGYRGAYDTFADVAGFVTLAARDASGAYPAVLEGTSGAGRVILCQLAVDEVALKPALPEQAKAAKALLKNLVDYAVTVAGAGPRTPAAAAVGVAAGAESATAEEPGTAAPPPAPRAWKAKAARVKVTVFEDTDGDGVLDPGEPPMTGLPVTIGREIYLSGADGTVTVDFPPGAAARVATVRFPATHEPTTPFFARVAAPAEARFGLRRRAAPPPDAFTIVQVSDVHIGAHGALGDEAELRARVLELNALAPRPAFLLSTGDVTASAKTSEMARYRNGVAGLLLPAFTLAGNHDRAKGPEHWDGFEREIGPVTFSFDYGAYHFVAAYEAGPGTEVGAWLAKDLALAKGKPIVLLEHHYPRRDTLDAVAGKGVVAVISGDWHGSKVEKYKGILSINTSTLLVGGIDHTPASFRLIHFGAGGTIESELRLVRATERLAVVSPPESSAAAAALPIVADAYDTVRPPVRVGFRIVAAGAEPAPKVAFALAPIGEGSGVTALDGAVVPAAGADPLSGALRATSAWSWSAPRPPLEPGAYRLDVTAVAADGTSWSTSRRFTLTKAAAPKPSPGSGPAWPMFRHDAARSGIADASVAPPLALAWILPTGSSIGMGSPVVSGGRVFLALEDRATVKGGIAGVIAADAVTGAVLWRVATAYSVAHSVAVSGSTVVFQEVDGTVHAVDAATGTEKWRTRLEDSVAPVWESHWISGAPVIDGSVVWAGYAPAQVALELATGKPLWVSKPHGREAFTSYASMSVASDGTSDRVLLVPSLHDGLRAYGLKGAGPTAGTPRPALLWTSKTRHRVGSSLAVANGTIYYPGGMHLVAVDALTGKTKWKSELPAGWHVSTPLVADGTVYAATARGTLVALDAETGTTDWEACAGPCLLDVLPYRRGYSGLSSSPALAGDTLYIGGDDGVFYALHREDGRVLWRYHVGTPVSSSPAIAGNAVYVASLDGNLYCFVGRR